MSILNGRHERGDFIIDGAINSTLSGGALTANVVIPLIGYKGISLLETFNGDAVHTLVADLTLEVSNNYDWANPLKTVNWDPITDAAILAWLTTDASASPKGGKPAGVAGTGSLQIDTLNFGALRFTVTRTAGTGLFVLDAKLSGNGRR